MSVKCGVSVSVSGRVGVCVCAQECVCVCAPCNRRDSVELFLLFFSRGCKQPIQSCTNEDTGCVLVKPIRDAGLTYLLGRKPT